MCNEAGMNSARRMLNPETLDRSTMWCKHCGKGFQKQKWLLKHQVYKCGQAKPDELKSKAEYAQAFPGESFYSKLKKEVV